MFSSLFLNPTGRHRFHLGLPLPSVKALFFSRPVGHKARLQPGPGSDASALTRKKYATEAQLMTLQLGSVCPVPGWTGGALL